LGGVGGGGGAGLQTKISYGDEDTFSLDTVTWHCCMSCNPENGRVDFEEWYKIQLHGNE
jgi:hypothetical protein